VSASSARWQIGEAVPPSRSGDRVDLLRGEADAQHERHVLAPFVADLTVAVTGATSELGKPFVRALEQTADVRRVRAMARRPFDLRRLGWRKTDYYSQRDWTAPPSSSWWPARTSSPIWRSSSSRRPPAATRSTTRDRGTCSGGGGGPRPPLVYTSSLAAYGYHAHEGLLTEAAPTHGAKRHAYSRQKADVERLLRETACRRDSSPDIERRGRAYARATRSRGD
jgi:hypothetical protein